MHGLEVRRTRERLGLSVDELAAALDASAAEIRMWEDGQKRIPGWEGRVVAWQLAMLEREQLLARSRLPECAWFKAWDADRSSSGAGDAEAMRHVAECHTCIRRRRYVEERLGPEPPFPEGAVSRILGPVADLFIAEPSGRTAGLALLVPALLLVAALFRYVPVSGALPWLLLPLAFVVGVMSTGVVFQGLPALRNAGPAGRWTARWLAISTGAIGFGGTFLLSGHDGVVSGGRGFSLTTVLVAGLLFGLFCSSIWSYARKHNGG